MIEEIKSEATAGMEKALDALKNSLSKLRTGRANLTVLDGVKVDYYGTMTPINQVATLSVPEPRLIVVQPWEATMISPIEQAIVKANIGLTPANDGKVVRLPVPQLTEERRKDIVKQLKSMAEDNRVSVRNARRDANDLLKKLQKDKEITEDDLKRETDAVQKLTDSYIAQIDEIVAAKEKDILKV